MSSPDHRPKPRGTVPSWVVPLAAVLLAVLAGGIALWAVHGRQTSGPAVPMAIVNDDQPVTQGSGKDAKTIAAGRELAASLNSPDPDDETPLSWQLVDADDAAIGLRDGTYYGVLTIPKDFSKAVTSTSGSKPEQAELKLVNNDATSAAVAALAQLSVDQAASALGDQATNNYVDAMLQNLTTINKNLTSSAKSADSLASSSHELADSAGQLADSSDQVADGAASLDSGTKSLESGTESLASGAAEAAGGAAQVASGSRELASAADTLADGAASAATGAADVSKGAAGLDRGAGDLAKGAADLSDAADKQDAGLGKLKTLTRTHADRSQATAQLARDALRDCRGEGGSIRFCEQVRRLRDRVVTQSVGARGIHAATSAADRAAGGLAKGAAAIDDGASDLEKGADKLAPAAKKVAAGVDDVSDGATQLDQAAGSLSSGASDVASGTRSVADGAAQTASGVQEMAVAAGQLASGTSQLSSGAHQLADGADQLADGADQLASGLSNGAKQVPSYTDDQRKALDTVVTTPVTVKTSADNPSTVAAGLIPVVLGLALWVGTLMMLLTRPPIPVGLSWAQASPVRRVVFGLAPVVLVGLAQAGLLLGMVAIAGVPISSPVGLTLFSGLGALAFAATNQALVSLFGGIGRLVSLAFALVEAAALAGLLPIETAPAGIQWLNGVLPLPQFVDGAGQLLLGGHGSLLSACLVLAIWTAIALGASVLAAARRSSRIGAADPVSEPPSRQPEAAPASA